MAFVVDVSLHILAGNLIANTIISVASATLNACAPRDRGVWRQQWNRASFSTSDPPARRLRSFAATCNTGFADLWQA